MHQLMLLKEKP